MSLKNVVRVIGVLMLVALIVALPQSVIITVAKLFWANLILMFVAVAAEIIIGIYLAYLIIRYVVIQWYQKILQ